MAIKIKGKTGGLFEIQIQPLSSYSDIREAIQQKLAKNKAFFNGAGAKILISGKSLSPVQKKDLRRLFQMDYDITDVTFADDGKEPEEKRRVVIKRVENNAEPFGDYASLVSRNFFNAKSIFVTHTLRSGQRIECEGDVVILGDVNDGAEVIAGGSVAVMGCLRGLVHAGATGRSDVVVAANALIPKQMRISGKIAIFPENKTAEVPEVAEYKHGSVVIRPLRPQTREL
ncbi:MAG: septum site-determining protein MinC [Burkholderiales bacterium]